MARKNWEWDRRIAELIKGPGRHALEDKACEEREAARKRYREHVRSHGEDTTNLDSEKLEKRREHESDLLLAEVVLAGIEALDNAATNGRRQGRRQRFTVSQSDLNKFLHDHVYKDDDGITLVRDIRDAAELLCPQQGLVMTEKPGSYRIIAHWMLLYYRMRPSIYAFTDPATGKVVGRQAYYGVSLSDVATTRLAEARNGQPA